MTSQHRSHHWRFPRKLRLVLLLVWLLTFVVQPTGSYAATTNPATFEAASLADYFAIGDSYVDSANNVYLTGTFDGTIDFDPGAGTSTLSAGASSLGDIFIAKYSAAGELAWARKIAAGQITYGQGASAIIADSAGNVFVAGGFYGTVDFDPGAGTANRTGQSGNTDAFLLKLDSSGNYAWAFDFGGSVSETADALAVDSSGNVYMTGSYYGAGIDADPGAGTITLPGADSQKHLYVLKASSTGAVTWAKGAAGTTGDPIAYAIAVDSTGKVYVGGTLFGLDFGGGYSFSSGYPTDYTDAFLWTLNSSGTTQNAVMFGGVASSTYDQVSEIAIDAADNVFLAGSYAGTTDFDFGVGTVNRTAGSNGSTFLLKLSSAGAFSMVKTWTGADAANYDSFSISGLNLLSNGKILLTGAIGGFPNAASVDIDPGAGTVTRSTSGILVMLDASGDYLYDGQIGSGGTILEVYPLSNYNAVVVGSVGCDYSGARSVDVDPSAGTANVSVAGCYEDPITYEGLYPNSGFFGVWSLDSAGLGAAPGANVAPEFDDADDSLTLSMLEDAGGQSLSADLAASDSDADQTLTWSQGSGPTKGAFGVSSGTASTPATAATPATAIYTPTANLNGSDSFTVAVSDSVGSDTLSVAVTITAVNDEPTLSLGSDPSASGADKGGVAQSVSSFATFDAGPADEDTGQAVLDYLVSEDSDPDNVVSGVDIANNGTLSFTPATNAAGSATISVQVQDNGGTANGGDDTSQSASFTISVNTYTPEIGVLGNGDLIADGSASPATLDGSDFGSVPANTGTITHTFTISNSGLGNLSVGSVSVGGANQGDFSVAQQPATSVAPGATTSFTVTFDPAALGTRSATLSFTNNDGDESPYSFAVQGTGAKENSQTTLTASPNPSSIGASVTFTATVAAAASSVIPSGSVTFLEGTTTLATETLNGSGVATFSTASLSLGTHAITAEYTGDSSFNDSASTALSQVVNKLSQTISFGALSDRTYGDGPFTLSASATSALTVSFSSLTTAVCTVAGDEVTMVGAGTCTIRAAQAGDADYMAAVNVEQDFTVAKASQTVSFSALSDRTYGDGPFTLSASATSGLTVSFSSLTTTVCTVAGSQLSIVGAGTCTIRAAQAGDDNYLAASNVERSFSVAKAAQTISFSAPSDRTYGDEPFTLGGSASSGLTIAYSSLTTTVCTVAGDEVTLIGAGTCTIEASQAGDDNYLAATDVSRDFGVAKATVTVSLSLTPEDSIVGQEVTATVVISSAAGTPDGSVTFKEGLTTLGSETLVNGSAALVLSSLTVGRHTIVAEYSGADNFATGAAAPMVETVYSNPLAVNDAAGTREGEAVTIAVLANDIGPATAFSIESITTPTQGTAIITDSGRLISYAPPANFSGMVVFSYTLRYENYTDSALVSVVVSADEETGTPPEVAVIDPVEGATISFGEPEAPFTMELDTDEVYTTTLDPKDVFYLAYTPVSTPPDRVERAPQGTKFGSFIFTLEAFLNSAQLEDFHFARPVTMTISYDPGAMGNLKLETLSLRYWTGSGWSTDGIVMISHDQPNQRITFSIAHLSEFAFFAVPNAQLTRIYLPAVIPSATLESAARRPRAGR